MTLQNRKVPNQDSESAPFVPPGIMEFRMATVRVKFPGARPSNRLRGKNERFSRSNYLVGNDPKRWTTHGASYERVHCQDVYNGIDGFAS